MRSAIVLLERSSLTSKQSWRESAINRTLLPVEVTRLIANTWESQQAEAAEQGSVVLALQADGAPRAACSLHPIQGKQPSFIGVFEVCYTSPDQVRVTLREEECARQIGQPRRPTRQIAHLEPWAPLRVLLNGRHTSYSGQHYVLREYHLTLCSHPVLERFAPTRFLDLQADLF